MNAICSKLSPLISKEKGKPFQEYLRELYIVYMQEIANENFNFHGKPVKVFNELNYNLQHQTFEHLTTKGNDNRLYNSKRCERLHWIKDILKNICCDCEDYRVFQDSKWKKKNNAKRYIIWCVHEDYVIILEERQYDVFLITAYCIIYDDKRKQLQKEYEKSIKNKPKTPA